MVIFCKKSTNTPLNFRDPTRSDLLGSGSRVAYLVPRAENEKDPEEFLQSEEGLPHGAKRVLGHGDIRGLEAYRDKSALSHWGIMRTVLPQNVWRYW